MPCVASIMKVLVNCPAHRVHGPLEHVVYQGHNCPVGKRGFVKNNVKPVLFVQYW